jgi:RimJ/RimL family protein N-acetyltransferase
MRMTAILTTKRLRLRPVTADDAPAVQRYVSDERVARMLSRLPYPYPDNGAATWIATLASNPDPHFALIHESHCIGIASLERTGGDSANRELGYWLAVPFWGQGLMSEAVGTVVDFGFQTLGLDGIVAGFFADNPASGRILSKTGFIETGREQRQCLTRGDAVDCVLAALTRDAWAARKV